MTNLHTESWSTRACFMRAGLLLILSVILLAVLSLIQEVRGWGKPLHDSEIASPRLEEGLSRLGNDPINEAAVILTSRTETDDVLVGLLRGLAMLDDGDESTTGSVVSHFVGNYYVSESGAQRLGASFQANSVGHFARINYLADEAGKPLSEVGTFGAWWEPRPVSETPAGQGITQTAKFSVSTTALRNREMIDYSLCAWAMPRSMGDI